MSNIDGPQYVRQESYVDPVMVDPVVPMVQQPMVVNDPRLVVDPAQIVVQPAAVAPVAQVRTMAPVGAVRTGFTRRFSPDAMIAAFVGLVLLIVGLLAVVRGGFDGPMDDPIVDVIGFTHTTTLGLIEIALGVCLLISGVTSSRSGALFFGSVLGIAAFVGAVQTDSFEEPLALESGLAWLMVISAIVVVASALLMPRFTTRSESVHQLQ